MDGEQEAWQQRIRELYTNVEELYSHVDVAVLVFDRDLVEMKSGDDLPNPFGDRLVEVARRARDTCEVQRDVPLDHVGRKRVHAFPVQDRGSLAAIACIVEDDGARRELFVRCAMAIFDGYREKEAELLERERHALEEARAANHMRDQFLAVIAHELRSPMASILLWEHALRNPTLDAETRTAALDAIHESAAGQALLIADMLDVSRAINGKLHIDRRVMPIERVLAAAIDTERSRLQDREVEVIASFEPDLGHVLGDSRRLRQVFDNLLSNATKCTDRGRVTVRARQTGDVITVDVCDTGRGISTDFLPHVFEPFRQADESSGSGGLGLGLGIARQLVELHGGTLAARSEGLGHGAQFTVTLPRVHSSGNAGALPRCTIEGIRILIVDDDPHILEALQLLLRKRGARVTTASSAAMAYGLLQQGQADLLLSDLAMPGESGCGLVRRLRTTPGSMRHLPAVAITASTSDEHRDSALAAGFDRYLTKPIDIDLLTATIAELAGAFA